MGRLRRAVDSTARSWARLSSGRRYCRSGRRRAATGRVSGGWADSIATPLPDHGRVARSSPRLWRRPPAVCGSRVLAAARGSGDCPAATRTRRTRDRPQPIRLRARRRHFGRRVVPAGRLAPPIGARWPTGTAHAQATPPGRRAQPPDESGTSRLAGRRPPRRILRHVLEAEAAFGELLYHWHRRMPTPCPTQGVATEQWPRFPDRRGRGTELVLSENSPSL